MRSPVNASPRPSRVTAHDSGVDVARYSFIARDLHPLLFAGLPAHTALDPIGTILGLLGATGPPVQEER